MASGKRKLPELENKNKVLSGYPWLTEKEMKKILPFLKHDTEMTALVKGTLEKMEHLTEEEFSKMDLTPYLTELLEDKEWI